MPARYKRKRHVVDWATDSTKHLKLEGTERWLAKKDIEQGVSYSQWYSHFMDDEMEIERLSFLEDISTQDDT